MQYPQIYLTFKTLSCGIKTGQLQEYIAICSTQFHTRRNSTVLQCFITSNKY